MPDAPNSAEQKSSGPNTVERVEGSLHPQPILVGREMDGALESREAKGRRSLGNEEVMGSAVSDI